MPTNQTQQKRIVIIEGDAFDADAIVAITKTDSREAFSVYIKGMDSGFHYEHGNEIDSDTAMILAILAWRGAVGDLPMVGDLSTPSEPLPNQPPPAEPEERIVQFWTDTKGRFYETYAGNDVYWGDTTGKFIWNEGPPRRKNPLGEGASPILKIYIGQDGKPLDPQPS